MGIFVEEASAFIIGGLIGLALLIVHYKGREGAGNEMYHTGYIVLIAVCLILAVIGVADVFLDHIGSDENSQQTTP